MFMARPLIQSEITIVQNRYRYLTNYQSNNLADPIDPVTYIDSTGGPLLHIAAPAGDLSTVPMLLHARVNVDEVGDMECTALHCAHRNGHRDLAARFKARGASTTMLDGFGKLPAEL